LLLPVELEPERDEDKDESDKPAHLRERDRGAEEPGQNAGVDGVADHCIGAGGDQLVSLLNRDGAAPLLPRCSRAQTAKRRPATMTVAPSQKDHSPAGQS
jgi:hypothetical protein